MSKEGSAPQGMGIRISQQTERSHFNRLLGDFLNALNVGGHCEFEWVREQGHTGCVVKLTQTAFDRLCPGHDTLGLKRQLAALADADIQDDLMREVLVALLAAPVRIDFDSLDDLVSHLRVRCNIARAAEKTALAFKTSDAAERPEGFWHYEKNRGFLLKPGVSLIDALVAATQPERTGRLYDFSCYRASEYVILLGLAQEAQAVDPGVYARLEDSARLRCIKSGLFHEVFLTEYGSLESPIPMRYYVPGDRVWFKNPDEASSNASGYEGSWVIYMGGGLFSNFWKRDRPYTLEGKALEVFHWRDGLYLDEQAEPQINEAVVENRMLTTQSDVMRLRQVLERMNCYRDPSGVYALGGCMDSSREFPRPLQHIQLI